MKYIPHKNDISENSHAISSRTYDLISKSIIE